MDSPPPPSQSDPTVASPEEVEAKPEEREKEIVHRTKVIQFLGRTTPIILQNDNGPCPLLAICNVLSLKNSLNLSPDIAEVSQEKLLSLVAERLIDSNSSIDNKDTGYVENQQQNISDAIDLLPRLTTGIDVNIKFRRIDDFEFTPECAIFDLLDIPLYHGWIVDPQDHETADAFGSKSYNTLMGELVSLETHILKDEQKKDPEDDIDFAAATTAALGVPSPSLSRGQSFDESPHKARKGDMEEEEMLLRALKLSEAEIPNSLTDGVPDDVNLHESTSVNKPEQITHLENVEEDVSKGTVNAVMLISEDTNAPSPQNEDVIFPGVVSQEVSFPVPKPGQEISFIQPFPKEPQKIGDNVGSDAGTANEHGKVSPLSLEHELSFSLDIPQDLKGLCAQDNSEDKLRSDEHMQNELITTSEPYEPRNCENDCEEKETTGMLDAPVVSDSADGQIRSTDYPRTISSPVDHSEPIYEGEECILDSGTQVFNDQEPVYEGEVVLAKQVDRGCTDYGGDLNGNEKLSSKQGETIRNFLISASQLTVYGLFCLQDKVKERELCVFFRNNHFNTMFKYEGELYILVTDQGYINQTDLVWEKLNEVNGDTVYMTGDFKEFKMDDQTGSTWNEKDSMDYVAGIDSTQASSTYASDLELAMALQQQEFEHQQQHERNSEQQTISDSSKRVSGTQASNSSGSLSKQESPKSKEKCIIM